VEVLQVARTIAAFNQGITSGMDYAVRWDFGDGGQATGTPVLHTYGEDGVFPVCAEVKLWGPLTPDTCTATACTYVSTGASTGTGALSAAGGPRAYPSPFQDQFQVAGARGMERWELIDALGRTRLAGAVPPPGT